MRQEVEILLDDKLGSMVRSEQTEMEQELGDTDGENRTGRQ